jgi:hypothetical protein
LHELALGLMLDEMNPSDRLAAPDPVAVSIHSDLAPVEVFERLGRAIERRTYSTPGRYSPGSFRLGGSVAGDRMTLTARPYVTPGLIAGYGAMTIELAGNVVPAPEGSEIVGTVTAPLRWTKWATFATFVALAWPIVGFGGNRTLWEAWAPLLIGALILSPVWLLILRHNQRMALANVVELTRMIETVLEEPDRGR